MASAELIDEEDADVAVVEGTGSFAVKATEVDVQIATAHRFPRSITKFKREALEMATLDDETAAGCFYCLPRAGKKIMGPSARLAEIVASSWGNIRAESKVVETTDKEVVAEALCWDLEKNVAIRVQVRRRITDSKGNRYTDDMIIVTGNAAGSIALRNAVFKVVPAAMTKSIYEAVKRVAIGGADTINDRRQKMVEAFGKMGVRPEQICTAVDQPSLEDVGIEEMEVLIGLFNAIRDGDTTVDQAFPDPKKPKGAESGKAKSVEELGKPKDSPQLTHGQASTEGKPKQTAKPKDAAAGELATPDQIDRITAFAEDSPKVWDMIVKKLGAGASIGDLTAAQAKAAIVEIKAIEERNKAEPAADEDQGGDLYSK